MATPVQDPPRTNTPRPPAVPRVLLGLGEVAGYYAGLRQGFVDLGVPVTQLELWGHQHAYGGHHESLLARVTRSLSVRERTAAGISRPILQVLRLGLQALFLIWAIPRHDVFVFAHGTSFLGQHDLPLLKRLGKTIICCYHGSDSRPPYLDGYWGRDLGPEQARRRIAAAGQMKRRIARSEQFADALINIPSQGHFHAREFVLGVYVGHPSIASLEPVSAPPANPKQIICLHAPTHRDAKGTPEIHRIVERLRDRGVPIVLREVTGVPNHVLLEQIRAADIVVDQLYSDYGSPGLATESMWLGRPVIIGGYGAEEWRRLLPPERLPPTIYCRPERVEIELERLAGTPTLRAELGAAGRAFVERHWQPRQVAERFLRIAAGSIYGGWTYEPTRNRNVHGCGLPEDTVRDVVRATLAEGGPAALHVEHNPRLEQALVEFAHNSPVETERRPVKA